MQVELFGCTWQKAAKEHVCWCCGAKIEVGQRHWRQTVKVDGRVTSFRHCREKCETAADMLDQNRDLAPAVFYPTISHWAGR